MAIGADTYAHSRRLIHLEKGGKTYFLTFATRDRWKLPPAARDVALYCALHDHGFAYHLHCAVVMPDHVHLVFTNYDGWGLARIMNRIKNASAHGINEQLDRRGSVWQREYFDRILRTSEDLRVKCDYVCNNPVRAGLVERVEQYQWLWRGYAGDAPPGAAALH